MMRFALALLLAVAVVSAARADRIADRPPLERMAVAEVVVIGKVTAIEKETVDAEPFPNAPKKVPFAVAVVTVDTIIHGSKNTTSIKVGFLPGTRSVRFPGRILQEGDHVCLFLEKHPSGDFYAIPGVLPALEVSDGSKETVDLIRKAGKVFDNPLTALKAEKAEDRLFAAQVLVQKYRLTHGGGFIAWEFDDVPAEETRLILSVIADGDWSAGGGGSPFGILTQLGLREADGFRRQSVKPGDDAVKLAEQDFKAWLDADGKKYQMKKYVPKK